MNKEELLEFEQEIAKLYEEGHIRAPVHLRDGNEERLIDIFKLIKKDDYVYGTWASHYHALLKGVPQERVRQDILEGRSITLHYPDYNFFTSAIVGGIAPIAVGTAAALAVKRKDNRVFCFLGDMSFHTGIAHESIKYAIGHNLPITFIVEDNNKSVCTDTEKTWGQSTLRLFEYYAGISSLPDYATYTSHIYKNNVGFIYYSFKSSYPHSGTGVFLEF